MSDMDNGNGGADAKPGSGLAILRTTLFQQVLVIL